MIRLARALGFAGGFTLLVTLLIENPTTERRESAAASPPAAAWFTGTFAPQAVFPSTSQGALPTGHATAGSWLGEDAATGTATTTWFPAESRRIRILVAGYPQHEGCRLTVEFRDRQGRTSAVAAAIGDPGETWLPWDIRLPFGTVTFRVLADDRSAGHSGWLAFSAPIAKHPTALGRILGTGQILGALLLLAGLLVPIVAAWRRRRGSISSDPGQTPATADGAPPHPRWWPTSADTTWFLLLTLVLLALKKPWALQVPQLWAEDGSIFLMQAEADGLKAIFTPYMGYFHLLPRLVAGMASELLDPAWWPAFYNGAAFAGAAGLLIRIASPRLQAPGKSGMMLAFVLVVSSGETLLNLTNLQWFTAFFLILQVMLSPPGSMTSRIVDLGLLVLIGLTGPFCIAFLPLFAWRWWQGRKPDDLIALLVVLACAGVQGWQVVNHGPQFDYRNEAFHAYRFVEVLGQRLVIWPLAGQDLALAAPTAVSAWIGGGGIILILVWALRPHPLRRIRAPLVAAFLLIVGAAVYRARPDTWANDNLWFGDRYFYIPRVLLAWLVIWELGPGPRGAARAALAVCLLSGLAGIREFQIKAPLDYLWAWRCEPVRRGEPAKIPILPQTWTLEYLGRRGSR